MLPSRWRWSFSIRITVSLSARTRCSTRADLALVALVAVASALYVVVGAPLLDRVATTSQRGVIQPTLIIGLLVMTALVLPLATTYRWGVRAIAYSFSAELHAILRRDLSERLSAARIRPETILDAAIADAAGSP